MAKRSLIVALWLGFLTQVLVQGYDRFLYVKFPLNLFGTLFLGFAVVIAIGGTVPASMLALAVVCGVVLAAAHTGQRWFQVTSRRLGYHPMGDGGVVLREEVRRPPVVLPAPRRAPRPGWYEVLEVEEPHRPRIGGGA